jgi:SAM-dependent methyltransferase
MKIKADWLSWLHSYKQREVEKTFYACPDRCFQTGLELGAGDGFQSDLLAKYICRLISTEINGLLLSRQDSNGVEYRICSAREAVRSSKSGSLDIVYSSNLLEHVQNPVVILREIHRVLKDDGVTIHIIPTPLWKLCQVFLYIPANLLAVGEHIFRRHGTAGRLREALFLVRQLRDGFRKGANTLTHLADRQEALSGNNPGIARRERTFMERLFFPLPHGVSATNLGELSAFRKRRWLRIFGEAGLECCAVRSGPAASGYGLGWQWAEAAIEKAGLASELIYIAHKKGHHSQYLSYFT